MVFGNTLGGTETYSEKRRRIVSEDELQECMEAPTPAKGSLGCSVLS
jgi:hypothetical protein